MGAKYGRWARFSNAKNGVSREQPAGAALTSPGTPGTTEIVRGEDDFPLLAAGNDSSITPDLVSIPLAVNQISPPSRSCHAFVLSARPVRRCAFTLVEMLVVIVVIAIVLGFLIPALSPSSARALEDDSRNFAAQLENARMMALAKRTKTRVLIASTNDWGSDFSWRAYVLASFDSTTGNWLQQGKFFRLSQSTTFDSGTGIVSDRSTTTTQVVKSPNATPTPAPSPFVGAYVEFNPTGSTSLDPSATPEIVRIQDGFVPSTGSSPTAVRKNQALHTDVSIDPASGGMKLQ